MIFSLVSLALQPLWALEIMPMVGFELHNKHDLAGPRNDRMDLRTVALRGLTAAYLMGDGQVELCYTRANSAAEIQQAGGAPPDRFDVRIEQFTFNGLYLAHRDEPLQPFILIGFGATKYTPDNNRSASLKPSLALGGGAKWLWGEHFGVRADARWTPSFAPTGSHFFCDSSGSDCYALEDNGGFYRRIFLSNLQTTVGLLIRF